MRPDLTRAERRQLRKAIGRKLGMEWRVFGLQTRGIHWDALNRQIAERAKLLGHAAQLRRKV